MISSEDIGYEFEIEENTTIEAIRESHNDGICIWVSGSGPSPSENSRYRIVMEANGKAKYMEKECPGKTANQVMIEGAKDAVGHILRPIRIYLIIPTSLGFDKGFKRKGVNAEHVQELFAAIKEKGCLLTEVRYINGSNDIKKYVAENNPDKKAVHALEEKQLWYKNHVYQECLGKVTEILKEYHIDDEVIRKVNTIHPTLPAE